MKIIVIFLGLILCITAFAQRNYIACRGDYVLCNAAKCVPIPGISGKVMCYCSVWKGWNVGYSSCKKRVKTVDRFAHKHLLSTFSFGGFHYKANLCKVKRQWASCLDKPCIIASHNPRKAYCTCDLEKASAFVTFATGCQQNQCGAYIWSAALAKENNRATKMLIKSMGLKKTPAFNCPE